MRGVWEKLSEKEPRNFTGELRLKTDFSVRTGCYFAYFICFIKYSYGYLMTSLGQYFMPILCLREYSHLVGPYKTYTSWEAEVSNKQYFAIF
jgi:hypothetical protein